jgi:predicted RNA-binding Zn-ribbon protein involved in translation (DUF1610 family)
MAEKPTRVQVRCSSCGGVIGILPEGSPLDFSLLCPSCGTVARPPTPLERIAAKVKELLGGVTTSR